MALVVDEAGKKKAGKNTGNVYGRGKDGASALRDAIGNDNSLSVQPNVKWDRQVFDDLTKPVFNQLTHDIKPSIFVESKEKKPFSPSSIIKPTGMSGLGPSYLSTVQPQGMSSSFGESTSMPTNDAFGTKTGSGVRRPESQSDWERQASERNGRKERTKNYFGEQYDQNDDWSYYGNTQSNDTYLRNAIDSGLSEDDAWAIMHRPQSIDEENELRSSRMISDNLYDNVGKSIDDGTSYDYSHMTSEWMTGPQYRRYVEMGMGGRDVDDIDPTQVYSKADEAREYGFIPFLPDWSSYASMAVGDVLRAPGELGTKVANARTSIAPDYRITYGDGTTINGNEFEKIAPTFLNNYYYSIQYDPERIAKMPGSTILEYAIPGPDGDVDYAHGGIVDSWYDDILHLSFDDGTEMDIPKEEYAGWDHGSDGGLLVPEEYVRQHGGFSGGYDDTLYLKFADGQTMGLSQDYVREHENENGTIDLSGLSEMVPVSQANGNLPDDMGVFGYGDITPNLVMSDGTVIPLDDVERIYWDKTAGDDEDTYDQYGNLQTDDDIRYDFGPLGLSKPRRLIDQEPFDFSGEGEIFNKDDLLNNVVDWTFGSAPISAGVYAPWVYSLSQATNSIYGIEPGSYNQETGSRGLSAGGWDENGNLRYGVQDTSDNIDQKLSDSTRWWNTLGNAAIPLTEQLVGPVGSHIIPLEGVTKKIPFKTDLGELAAKTLVGWGAEGIEEDLGNVFEELMRYGPSGAFANPVLGDDDQSIKDIYGHEVRDAANTSDIKRALNFADPTDLANAFLGGFLVSPAMGLATSPINSQSFLHNVGPAVYRDMARRQTGVDRYVETDLEREVREALEEGRIPNVPKPRQLSDEYVSMFDDVFGER